MWSPNANLKAIAFFSALLFACLIPGLTQSQEIGDRIFFRRDIFLFVGPPFPSPPLYKILPIKQRFRSSCANLNRLILPFAYEDKTTDRLRFQLFRATKSKILIYEETIDISKFQSLQKMGTHNLKGTFYTVWFPIQQNSKNTNYIWALSPETSITSRDLRLYLTNRANPQVPSLYETRFPSTRAAFYTYCKYQFNWRKIAGNIGHRFKRETKFLAAFLFLIAGNVYWIFRIAFKARNSG